MIFILNILNIYLCLFLFYIVFKKNIKNIIFKHYSLSISYLFATCGIILCELLLCGYEVFYLEIVYIFKFLYIYNDICNISFEDFYHNKLM